MGDLVGQNREEGREGRDRVVGEECEKECLGVFLVDSVKTKLSLLSHLSRG